MTLAAWAMWDQLTPSASNLLKPDYTWHVLQSTVTMATALIGAAVGNILWKRGERLAHGSSIAGSQTAPLRT
jgi:hypothetical protein